MAEQSANEAGDFLTWHFVGRPAIVMRRRVMEGIDAEADVRKERNLNLARYGRMSVYKISDIQIRSISSHQVSVTFRKMWQSSGPRITSGEEKEQLILGRDAAAWRIVSEQEIKVYWMKKPHLLARSTGN